MTVEVVGSTASAQKVRSKAPPMRHAAPVAVRATVSVPSRRFRPIKIGPHTFYGAIAKMSGGTIVVRTRRQRLRTVDATTVLEDGTHSAPPFVGKLVAIDGNERRTASSRLRISRV
jgi:hypothetical protein